MEAIRKPMWGTWWGGVEMENVWKKRVTRSLQGNSLVRV